MYMYAYLPSALYPKRPLRQRVTHLTPLLSRDLYMYNEVVLIDD